MATSATSRNLVKTGVDNLLSSGSKRKKKARGKISKKRKKK